MLAHVRTKPSRTPVEIHLTNKIALNQSVQAIVYGGHRNLRHGLLGTHENLFRGWMIAPFDKHAIHLLSLRREAKAARCQSLIEAAVVELVFTSVHFAHSIDALRFCQYLE